MTCLRNGRNGDAARLKQVKQPFLPLATVVSVAAASYLLTVDFRRLAMPIPVRTAQFDTILNEPPVIIIQMRVNTCLPESVPRVIPHLETRITDTSFIQNNIKSGSPGMCSNIRPESAYAHTVYNRIHRQKSTKSSFILSEFPT